MISTRKALRDAMKAVLSDATTGFNARLASSAVSYGITAFTITWTTGSRNFFQGWLDPTDAETISQLFADSALCLYTSSAVNEHRQKPSKFSGPIVGHVDIYLKFRDGIETDDTESICEACEAAVIECFANPAAAWPANVTFGDQFNGQWGPIQLLQDGWMRVVPCAFVFEVNA